VTWGIVQQHGGMIHCYSEPGRGTSFKIYLPAAEADAADVGTKIAGPVPKGTERVLVADDQPDVLAVTARVLTTAGYTVVTVSNGADAVAAARREVFDLHVLDTIMPALDGRQTCERIRAERPGARFLFMSGYGGDALPAAFVTAVGARTITKPFDPDAFLRAARAALDGDG